LRQKKGEEWGVGPNDEYNRKVTGKGENKKITLPLWIAGAFSALVRHGFQLVVVEGAEVGRPGEGELSVRRVGSGAFGFIVEFALPAVGDLGKSELGDTVVIRLDEVDGDLLTPNEVPAYHGKFIHCESVMAIQAHVPCQFVSSQT
jgi:hypothetical protein